jgi:hypothetical protein
VKIKDPEIDKTEDRDEKNIVEMRITEKISRGITKYLNKSRNDDEVIQGKSFGLFSSENRLRQFLHNRVLR